MKKFLVSIMAGVLALAFVAGCSSSTPAPAPAADKKAEAPAAAPLPADVKAIKDRGVFKVGTKADVPKFGYKDPKTGQIDGFEVDLARAIAKAIIGDNAKVEASPVNAKTRGPALDNGEIDAVIATFTITEDRKKSWNFSDPYYQDAVGLLVKKDGGLKSLKDFNDKTIGVAQSSTSKAAVQAEADKAGVKLNFLEFATYPEIKAALDAGRVQAFSVDGAILAGYVDDKSVILPDRFSPQNYGVATKLDNKGLAQVVNDVVTKMKANGEMDNLLKKWGLK
ncbi:MAG TPA: transporter substrate-binding domain-containing protein [Symbiobacteriaceae bacterium]|jgi:putative glutamine transport system substrate-binding protein